MSKPIFIAGTDTGVGKTVASLFLLRFLYKAGHLPFYWKAIQTGCRTIHDTDSDARFVYENCPQLREKDYSESIGLCFKTPKAPRYAAWDEQSDIHVEDLLHKLAYICRMHSPVIVEGAGGLMVPITDNYLMADFAKEIDAQVLLIARAGLGTINHTLLSVEALRHRGVEPAGIVFCESREHDTPDAHAQENMEAVSIFSQIPVSGALPLVDSFATPPQKVWSIMERVTKRLVL